MSSDARRAAGAILGVLVVTIGFGVLGGQVRRPSASVVPVDSRLAPRMPAAPPLGAQSTSWYCAGGTGTANGVANQTVSVVNTGPRPAKGYMEVVSSAGQEKSVPVKVGSYSQMDLTPDGLEQGPFIAERLLIHGGQVSVLQSASGSSGQASAPCSSATSSSWYFAAGSTASGAQLYLSLFNPAATDAIVEVQFLTSSGPSSPANLQGVVVPAGGLVVKDVGRYVLGQSLVATEVHTAAGRLVADELQVGDAGKPGLALTLGAPAPVTTWRFPRTGVPAGTTVQLQVLNPTSVAARVDAAVELEAGQAAPFVIEVPADSVEVLVVSGQVRLPVATEFAVTVRSMNGVPVVAERTVLAGPPLNVTGYEATLGASADSTAWLVGSFAPPAPLEVIGIQDVTRKALHVAIRAIAGGYMMQVGSEQLYKLDPGIPLYVTVPASLASAGMSLLVSASGKIVVEQDQAQPGGLGITSAMGVVVPGHTLKLHARAVRKQARSGLRI